MQHLILWDIDGTLLLGGAAATEAYYEALRSTYELSGELRQISFAGKTDIQIAVELLSHQAIAEAEVLSRVVLFRQTYTQALQCRRERLQHELRVLSGVPTVLASLHARGVKQSLLTGNFEETARIKLSCAGLAHFFDFAVGAFGSDHHDRNCLVPIALEKLQRLRGQVLAPEQVLVVGDTPRDIACARAGGARVVAVASGSYSLDALAAHAPDALLPDLSDSSAALAAILCVASQS